jgi:hypothetical protein
MNLENQLTQSRVKELKIGDYIRTEEMTIFQKITNLEQDKYYATCIRISFNSDQKSFSKKLQVVNKNSFVEFRKAVTN